MGVRTLPRMMRAYILEAPSLAQPKMYSFSILAGYFKDDVDSLVQVAESAVEEGEMDITLKHKGELVRVRRVLMPESIFSEGKVLMHTDYDHLNVHYTTN